MTSLTDFLLARIAEDEWVAREAMSDADPQGRWTVVNYPYEGSHVVPWEPDHSFVGDQAWETHATIHGPARVLADCEAKRRIVELHHATYGDDFSPQICGTCGSYPNAVDYPCDTLLALAQPHADHPDYRDEWKP